MDLRYFQIRKKTVTRDVYNFKDTSNGENADVLSGFPRGKNLA